MIVDASVVTDALLLRERRDLRVALAGETLHAPALIDYEVLSAVRGLQLAGQVSAHGPRMYSVTSATSPSAGTP